MLVVDCRDVGVRCAYPTLRLLQAMDSVRRKRWALPPYAGFLWGPSLSERQPLFPRGLQRAGIVIIRVKVGPVVVKVIANHPREEAATPK
jgi:hypothetical protein